MTLDRLVAEASVLVCCGSGGVGKTTTSGALAIHAAHAGRRAVVVTIDPAKRLADALGVGGTLGNEPVRVRLVGATGELWAMMLDTESTFDTLVRRHAADDEQAARILGNRFYRNIAGGLSGTQEYMAAEKLHELHNDARFDLVVVDTAPTRSALDFLRAPHVLARFLDHPLFKMLMMPARRGLRVMHVAAQPVLRTIGKVVGSDVLADALAFFQAFAGMENGFRDRAEDVQALLRAPTTRYVLVASPRPDTADEARYFAGQLAAYGLSPGALVLNRLQPTFGADEDPAAGVALARARAASLASAGDATTAAAWANLAELREIAVGELRGLAALTAAVGEAPVRRVPLLPSDVHDLGGLEHVRRHLFGGGDLADEVQPRAAG